MRDPLTGDQVVMKAYRTSDCYHGAWAGQAPDIIVGYSRGYRASWQTALGKFPRDVFLTNDSKWSGDHLMAADALPGTLLVSRPLSRSGGASLPDVTATLLDCFGVPTPAEMLGRSLI